MQIDATAEAADTVRRVEAGGRSDLTMVLSNGCCDSTAPYLYDHHIPEPDSTQVGEIAGVRILAPAWLVKLYPGDERLTVDVEQALADDSLSLETDFDRRFVLRAPAAERRD